MSTPVDRLNQLIKELKTTPEEFSKKIKMDVTPVLSKKQQLSFPMINAIVTAYKNVNPDWITFGTGNAIIKTRERVSHKQREKKLDIQVAERLQKLRKSHGWSVADFAKLTGLSSSGYFGIEQARTSVSIHKLVTFCKVLKVSYAYLIDGEDTSVDYYKKIIADKDVEIKLLREKAFLYDQIVSLTQKKGD